MALSDYYTLNNLNEKSEEYDSFFNYMIRKDEINKINEETLFKKEKELNFQNFIGNEKDRVIPRKKEIENLFQNSERVSGIKSSIDFIEDERSRFSATTKKQNQKVTEPYRVNRGLGLSYNDNSQSGIHPIYRPKEKTIDDLRSKSNQKVQIVNPPITQGKKESKFLNSISKESLTRTPIKLLQKATQLLKNKSYIYAPAPKENITLKKEKPKKQLIGTVNKNSAGLIIPGVFEPPKSTRKLTGNNFSNIGQSNNSLHVNNNNSFDIKSKQSNSYQNINQTNLFSVKHQSFQNNALETPPIKTRNTLSNEQNTNVFGGTTQKSFKNNFIESPEITTRNTLSNESNTNISSIQHQSFKNNFIESPEISTRNTLSNEQNTNLFSVQHQSFQNNFIESPEITTRNTLSNESNTNISSIQHQSFQNNTIEIPEMTMKEINTEEKHIKNILPVFKNFYNKVLEKPKSTERETYNEKEKGNVFKNNETYNKFIETPETTMRELNSENTNIQHVNDPSGLGYTSNIKEFSSTMREMYSDNKKQNSNIKNSNRSFTINTRNLNPTQRQFDSINSNGNIGIKSKNSLTKIFDKNGVCISDRKNMIETQVEKRKPTQRNIDIIPSKSIIGNVELKEENKQNIYVKKYNPVKNHTDICKI